MKPLLQFNLSAQSLRAMFSAALCASLLATASQGQTIDNARFVSEVMVNAQFDQGMDAMRRQMPRTADGMRKHVSASFGASAAEIAKGEEAMKRMQPALDRMLDQFSAEMRKPEIRNEVLGHVEAAYQRIFTPAEIDAMAAYYRSPLGASALTKMGAFMADMAPAVNEVTMRAMQPAMAEMMESMKKLMSEAAPN